MKIGIAEAGHVPALLELIPQITDDVKHGSHRLVDLEQAHKIFKRMQDSGQVFVVVATDEGQELLGACVLVIVPNFTYKGKSWGVIEHVVVNSSQRGAGIGAKLMQWTFDFAKDKGCYKVNLISGEEEDQINFYNKVGFSGDGLVGFRKYLND